MPNVLVNSGPDAMSAYRAAAAARPFDLQVGI